MKKYLLALDQGTTSSRALIFDEYSNIIAVSQKDFTQLYPKPSWVEHNPKELWSSQIAVLTESLAKANLNASDIAAIGITNQRETTLLWDKKTGEPIYNAIVWQDRRMADYCEYLKKDYAEVIKQKTGLVVDAYFSATKLKWILDTISGAKTKAQKGELCFGTVDTWLVYNLTKGKVHITDVSNASRTMLFNINSLEWDEELLRLFDIPKAILPDVKSSSEIYGYTATRWVDHEIPIAGIAGDQQAALFGQMCTEKGMMKNTYGTGCFLLMNTGDKVSLSKNQLLSTIAWKIGKQTCYALEGSVFIGGAAIQWLRDGLRMIRTAADINSLAATEKDNGGVYFVPALAGLGAPYWDQYARGSIFGISRATTDGHIARACLEGIAFQVYDIVKEMEKDLGHSCIELRVDGGASASDYLMQIQADLFHFEIKRPKNIETTALGAGYLAGIAVGYFNDIQAIKKSYQIDKIFKPQKDKNEVEAMFKSWHKAVQRTLHWQDEVSKESK
ncbi:glycerol kinase GlpK [Campylobacter sp. MIT 21-1685]|uniref:glycerol kinase GlpK n=1 Tax=unclassified Campylobacter TaxID=2593542 RepID=UPI00224B4F21|nr:MULTISPECIES: glycerol kinase GlpK [unclassified Campylobacter]MCX2683036.1 glycerol kinase GlpK [Campylobacter sp. MIT 21-1684]MCX2751318.1 glycerol kinase GlpK [Campylobacter sp. MIT 21-1682]MCX2807517.1 glycerol kinase GlpK [Campylobacter sp. MIT 21-1685]